MQYLYFKTQSIHIMQCKAKTHSIEFDSIQLYLYNAINNGRGHKAALLKHIIIDIKNNK